jgi:hypothetical protein
MTRMFRSVGFVLVLAVGGLGAGAFAWTAGGSAAAQSGGFTPLPPGWELCVLEGVTAPATAANVADLDEWQAAEGGSTNNTAAFNPFNTQRTTDATGAALPAVPSANGFPAFSNWAAGCAATVGTLYQPNMWVIVAALRAGNVTPASAFLAVVDQSSWCAPSPSGVPCYVNAMESTPGSLALDVPASSALDVYGNVTTDLQSYQRSITTVAADQNAVAVHDLALAASQSKVAAAQQHSDAASHALQGFAVNEYVNSGLYTAAPLVSSGGTQPFTANTPQSSDGVVAQQYLHVAASNLLRQSESALAELKGTRQQRSDAAKALGQAALTLASDEAAESRSLDQLVRDVDTLEHAGACATVTITPPPAAAATPAAAAAPGATAATTTTTVPATTTTAPSTTTSTVPATTTTTTTTLPAGIPLSEATPTSSTTTVPSTTTTTTTVPATTTTTTVPAAAAPATATAPPAEASGVTALQGCIATFAPPTSA